MSKVYCGTNHGRLPVLVVPFIQGHLLLTGNRYAIRAYLSKFSGETALLLTELLRTFWTVLSKKGFTELW